MIEVDAVVALSGDFTPEGGIGESTKARMDTALHLIELGITSRLIVTGSNSFVNPEYQQPLSHLMAEYAIDNHMSADVYVEDSACDTVGNAVFTKTEFTEPNNWKNLIIVTNEFHLPRSLKIFTHVMGADYEINGVAAPNKGFPHQWLWERAAGLLTKAALAHTNPGDTGAIEEQLLATVPGYRTVSIPRRIYAIASGIVAR